MHVACIPRGPLQPEVPDILFAPLQMDQHWAEDLSVVMRRFGLIIESVHKELSVAATIAIERTLAIVFKEESVRRYVRFLIMLLHQVVDHMNYLPAVATRALAIATHVQRLCLELASLKTYVNIVVGRMKSSEDFSWLVLDVVGGFLREGAATQTWHRVGLPYWVL